MENRLADSDTVVLWENVLRNSKINTLFITPSWQQKWWDNFSTDSEVTVEVIYKGESPIGVLPIMKSDGIFSFIGSSSVFDYMDFPVVLGEENEYFQQIYKKIIASEWESIRLESIPEDSPTLAILPSIFERNGYSVSTNESDKTPLMELPEDWETYLLNLRKKDRHELKRKIRRLENNNSYSQYVASLEEGFLESEMADFFKLMSMSMTDKDDFLTQQNKTFFIDIAREFYKQNRLKLYFLEVDGEKAAACICFYYDNTVLLYNSGYNPDYSSLSVGLINKALTIKEAINAGYQTYNFLRGTEQYKYHLGAKDKSVIDLIITNK
jgi:CelD/BcsL family acetyltransferase involved in cellulose biosynthesis